MTNRTYKVFGFCYAQTDTINIEVKFNGSIVFNGPVPTTGPIAPPKANTEDIRELCTFTASTDVVGDVPMSITPSGGECIFGKLSANYTGYSCFWAEDTTLTVHIAPVDSFEFLSTPPPSSDYKRNVFLDGVDITPVNLDDVNFPNNTTGWLHLIPNESVLTLDYFIDPTMFVLDVPTTSPDNTYPYPVGEPSTYPYSTVIKIKPL